MKKLILFSVFLLAGILSFPGLTAHAQEQESDLVKLKKQEEERRKKLKQPGKTITNEDLEKYAVPKKKRTAATKSKSGGTTAGTTKTTKKTGKNKPAPVPKKKVEKPDPKQTREYWQHLKNKIETKLAGIKEQVEKDQLELNRLHNALFNAPLPVEEAKLKTQITELTRSLETNKMRLKNIQEEYDSLPEQARKAGVPPGWVR